jgi:predicted DNA-binding protein (MmcQ/YjbR family)
MNIEELRAYCLSKKAVEETTPFGDDTLVYKVKGKVFALASINKANSVNLKCEPEKAILLREEFEGIQPGYHMNKKHWNTVYFNGVSDKLCIKLIDHSYELVVEGLPKKIKSELME